MLLDDSVVVLVAVVIIHLFKYFWWEILNSFITEKIFSSCEKHSIVPDPCNFHTWLAKNSALSAMAMDIVGYLDTEGMALGFCVDR